MKNRLKTQNVRKSQRLVTLIRTLLINQLTILVFILALSSCSDFVEVDPPQNILISEQIFDNPTTVESALANIYFKIREQGMVSGRIGLSTLMGAYSDDLDYYGFNADFLQLYNHNVTATNTTILGWWSSAYNLIYSTNDIIAGVENSTSLNEADKERFRGQALFIRAYVHSLLVSIFGDIPYITTTDYLVNGSASRLSIDLVFENLITDLISAVNLLEGTQVTGERVLPSQSAALALLARVYLYNENWELAESTSSQLIGMHNLESNVENVFLKESDETLWQLKPGENPRNTQEANELIIQFIPGQQYGLTNSFMSAFEPGDLRQANWTGSITNTEGTITLNFAHKYKALLSETETMEYSIVFRLSEQYLIRSESRAHLGNIVGSQQDLNTIRNRAGLSNTTASNMTDLLEANLKERRVELFTEHGHRWFDLNRTGTAGSALSLVKPNWQPSDILFPIPESELEINPNLLPQNTGY